MIITAHSGCDGTPPNSREFIDYAFSSSADAVEVDVRLYGEKLILSHDEPKSETVPFDEALSLLRDHPEKKLNCDLKTSGLDILVYESAKKFGVEDRLIYTGEVDPELFKTGNIRLQGVSWYVNLSALASFTEDDLESLSEKEQIGRLTDCIDRISDYDCAGINWHYKYADLVWDNLKKRGVGISVWTVSDREHLEYFIKKEPDNITTTSLKTALSLIHG